LNETTVGPRSQTAWIAGNPSIQTTRGARADRGSVSHDDDFLANGRTAVDVTGERNLTRPPVFGAAPTGAEDIIAVMLKQLAKVRHDGFELPLDTRPMEATLVATPPIDDGPWQYHSGSRAPG